MASKKGILVTIISILFVLSCGGGGSDDSGGGGGGGTNDEFIQSIIDDFVDNVVIPTYDLLRERSISLRQACEALEADPTEENLEAA